MYNNALKKIYDGDKLLGMNEIAKTFNINTFDNDVINSLYDIFVSPNLETFNENYIKNTKLLKDYPYIFNKNFQSLENNTFILFPIDENIFYEYNKFSCTFEKIEVNSTRETKYFFEFLDNPLLVENEFNEFNLNFLVDNVRASEDVAYENHIYLYYDNIRVFSKLLYYCDFEPLLKNKKVVFLFDREKSKYPIDFKEKFGIDYDSMEFHEVRPNEIKRLIIQQHMFGSAGNGFREEIFDWHTNLLTAKNLEAGFSIYNDKIEIEEFLSIVNECIENDDFKKIEQKFLGYTPLIYHFKDNYDDFKKYFLLFQKLCKQYKVKSKKDWLIISFIAYSKAYNKIDKSRISPAIHHMLHYVRTNDEGEKVVEGYHSTAVYQKCLEIYNNFNYIYIHNPVRDPIVSYSEQYRLPHTSYVNDLFNFNMFTWWWQDLDFSNSSNLGISHKFDNRVSIRFEDLKLNPKATLISMCRFFNIPYDVNLEIGTRDGEQIYSLGNVSDKNGIGIYKGESIVSKISSAYTTISLFDLNKGDVFDEYDIKRLETILYPAFTFIGNYEPCYNDYQDYTDEQVFQLFKKPFKFEEEVLKRYPENAKLKANGKTISIKEYMQIARLQFAKQAISYRNLVKHKIANNQANSYKVLMPDERYLVNEIYKNIKSLPLLEDNNVSFLID